MTFPDRYWTAVRMWPDGTITFEERLFETPRAAVDAVLDAYEFTIFQNTRHRGEAWMAEDVTEEVLADINKGRDWYDEILPSEEAREERRIAGDFAEADAREHVRMERMAR